MSVGDRFQNWWANITNHPIQSLITGAARVAGGALGGPVGGAAAGAGVGRLFNNHNQRDITNANAQGMSEFGQRLNDQIWGPDSSGPFSGATASGGNPFGGATSSGGQSNNQTQTNMAQLLGIPNYGSSTGGTAPTGNPFAGATSSGNVGYVPQGQPAHGNSYGGHSSSAPGGSSGGGLGGSWGGISSAQLSQLISGLGQRDHSQMSPGMQADILTNQLTGVAHEVTGPNSNAAARAVERNRAAQRAQGLI